MKKHSTTSRLLAALLALATGVAAFAAAPPAPKLLPGDTVAVLNVPDWQQAAAFYRSSAMSRFWHDPAMKPVKDKFDKKFAEEVVAPLEKILGVKLADYAGLAQGQMTFALTRTPAAGITGGDPFGWLLIMDSGAQKDRLTKLLADARKRWVDSGRKVRTEKLRGAEFTTITLTAEDMKALGRKKDGASGASPDPDAAAEPAKDTVITLGQSDALFLAGSSARDIEQVLARQGGSVTSSLAENAEYEAVSGIVRASRLHLWINVKTLLDHFLKEADAKNTENFANPIGADPKRIVEAIGLGGWKSMVVALDEVSNGSQATIFLAVPESGRKGLMKILAVPAKDAAPPAFVPADAMKYTRWRADGQQLWATLETMLMEIQPQIGGMLKMTMEMAGKDKDPNFDLRKTVIDNLGDDLITYQRPPRSAKLADLSAPPTLYLVGSPKPEELLGGIKVLTGLTGLPDGTTEREVAGRKMYSVKLAPERGAGGAAARAFHYSHGRGYVAMTTDEAMLEEFLRSTESGGRGLRDTAGLGEAAAKIGGTGTGWFGYENQAQTMRLLFDAVKKDPAFADNLFSNPAASALAGPMAGTGSPGAELKEWFDFTLLPPYEQVAKYFHYSLNSGTAQREGISIRTVMPNPPNLPKASGSGGR